MRATITGLSLLLAIASAAVPARADDAADIRARLEQWTEDFNAKRAEPVCDLFSKELLSTVRGQGDKDYAARCDILTRSLDDPARQYHYELDLHEVIVEGDLAVVRLTWTLSVRPKSDTRGQVIDKSVKEITAIEPGLDVFRKESDGRWRIVRYMAFEE